MRKNEKILFIATPLAETSLICIGFASWNLGANNGAEANITIESGSFIDTSLKFDSTEMISGALNFDAYSLDSYGKVYASTDADENLELIIDGKVNGYSKTWDLIRVNFRIEPKYLIKYNELVALGYIEEPTFNDLRKDDSSIVTDLTTTGSYWRSFLNDEENNRSFRFRYSFNYGKFFNYENPSLFFDSKNFNGEKTGESYTFEEKKKILNNLQEINSAKFSVYLDIVDSSKTKTIKFNSNGGSFSSIDTSTTITKSDLILHDKIKFPICYKTNCNFLGWNVNGTLYEGNKYYYVDEIFLDDSLSEISFTAEYDDLTTSGTLSFVTGELYASASVKVLIYSNKNGSNEISFTNSTGGSIANVLKGDRIKIVPVSNVANISYTGLSSKLPDGWQNVIDNTFSISVTPDELCQATINYSCSGTKLAETYFEYNFEVKNSSTEKISTYVSSKIIGKGKYIRILDVHGVESFSIDGLTPDSEGYYYINRSSITINVVCKPSYNVTFVNTNTDSKSDTPTVDFTISNDTKGYSYPKKSQSMGTISNCIVTGDKVKITKGNNTESFDGEQSVNGANITMNVKATTSSSCFVENTKILMADKIYKNVQDVRISDKVLIYNHYTGKVEVAEILGLVNHGYIGCKKIRIQFSNGSNLDILNSHMLFDIYENKYVSISCESIDNYKNDEFIGLDKEQKIINVRITKYEIKDTYEEAYSIITINNLNVIAENLLTLTPVTKHLVNYLRLNNEHVIDKEKMNNDIELYGTYTYDYWSKVMDKFIYDSFNVKYLKIAVGKGILSELEIKLLVRLFYSMLSDSTLKIE